MDKHRVKVALIGAGHLGKVHIQCMKQVPDIQLVGVWDIQESTKKQIASEHGIEGYDHEDQLFSSVDALVIASPTLTHFEWALKGIQQGKHIFIEKPATATVAECTILENAIEGKNLVCQIGHVERFNPAYLAIKDQVSRPLFIEGHRLAEFKPRGTDVSVIMDLMIHDIDLVLSLVKEPLTDIRANGVAVMSPTPDICNARLEFRSGTVANLTASRISLKQMRKLRIFQSDAYIGMDLLKKESQIVRIQSEAPENHPFAWPVETGYGTKFIRMDMPEALPNNAIVDELKAFAHSILTYSPVAVSLMDGRRALEVAEAILVCIHEQSSRIQLE